MKTWPFLALLLMTACNNDSETKSALVKNARSTRAAPVQPARFMPPVEKYGVEGLYTGMFMASRYNPEGEYRDNRITIFIDSLDEVMLYGHSVVAGNERPFAGPYQLKNGSCSAEVREPGDNAYDGHFTFTIDAGKKLMKGTWQANNKNLPAWHRHYELPQQNFNYDASLQLPEELAGTMIYSSMNEATGKAEVITEDVLRINASARLLKSSDIENLYKTDLEVIRNAIYARHGYSFRNLRMRDLFDYDVSWYMPVSANVSAMLTETEIKNIELIKRYEAHATRYYDVFGR